MSAHIECHRTIAELQQRCRCLEAENRNLRGTVHVPSTLAVKRALDLRLPEAALLVALSDGKEHTYARLAKAVGSKASVPSDLIGAYLFRLRRKLKWLRVVTVYNFGAVIEDAESLARIQFIIKGGA